MMEKFAQNISEPQKWCSHWSIDKNNISGEADYVDNISFLVQLKCQLQHSICLLVTLVAELTASKVIR